MSPLRTSLEQNLSARKRSLDDEDIRTSSLIVLVAKFRDENGNTPLFYTTKHCSSRGHFITFEHRGGPTRRHTRARARVKIFAKYESALSFPFPACELRPVAARLLPEFLPLAEEGRSRRRSLKEMKKDWDFSCRNRRRSTKEMKSPTRWMMFGRNTNMEKRGRGLWFDRKPASRTRQDSAGGGGSG
ncbi:hypothetical protein KSP40_PGU000870 [Platanthera guangdongensis]|uniref:Uncharacterized protein n=1 Tax=Platanthera guangdongensis TaxID=2320717 RepID=A0ABR2N494_9ASPA